MGPRESHMSQSDLFSWSMEQDPVLRSTIVTVLTLDRDPDWDRLVRTADRGSRVVPRLRQRLEPVSFGLAPPRWIDDEHFDLTWHVRRNALPPPADLSTVLEFARTEAMTAFDPARPLWRITLLSGLAGGGCALVLTMHHSLTDGIGGIRMAAEIFDLDREGTERPAVDESAVVPSAGWRDTLAWNWSVGADLLRSGATGIVPIAWQTLRNPLRTVREATALAASIVRLVRPVTETLSPVMTERGLSRRLAVLDIPAEPLHLAAHAVGCTMNDAFLAGVLIGLRTYHDKFSLRIDHLRLTMPISLRAPGDPMGGNRITLARFALPVDIAGAADLMRALDTVIEAWRREPAIPLSGAVAAALNRLPVSMITGMLKHVDFVASDVPGSPVPLYVAGARIDRMYAFGPTIGTAFNVTLTSHAGTCCIGINADTAAVPDPDLLADCLATGFRTVLRLAEEAPPNRGKAPARLGVIEGGKSRR